MSLFSHFGFFSAGSRRRPKSRRPEGISRRGFRARVEQLEPRRMLAITPTFSAGVLTFTGDAANDSLVTAINGNTVTYIADGGPQTVQPGVTSMSFNGGGGTNTISVQDTAGGSTLTVNGNLVTYTNASTPIVPIMLANVQSLQAADNSNSGHDTINVQATTIATTIGYLHGNGVDNYNVSSDAPTNLGAASSIAAPLTVNSGAGANTLVVGDSAGLSPDNIGLTSSTITGLAPVAINYTQSVTGTLGIVLVAPTLQFGNTFTVTNTLGTGNSVTLDGGNAGGNTFNIGSSAGSNNGQLSNLPAAIIVNGGLGSGNSLEVDDHGTVAAINFNYDITPTAVTTDASTPRPFGGVTYSGIQSLQLDATEQPNVFTVTPSLNTAYSINGYGPTATGLPGGNVPIGMQDTININLLGAMNFMLNKTAVPPGGNSFNGSYTFSNFQTVSFTSIERFTTQPLPAGTTVLVYGSDAAANGAPEVKVVNAATGAMISEFLAYEPTFAGGVNVATGFFDGTGQQEIAVAPGRGHSPTVKVFDLFGNLIFQFQAYAANFTGGINIAAGNVEGLTSGGHELDDIVTAPSYGLADIRVFHNQFTANPAAPMTLFREFNPFGTSFIGGATVAAADMTGNGKADIIVGSGPGMAPVIEVFNPYSTFGVTRSYDAPIHPFTTSFRGGVWVSAIGKTANLTAPLIVASQGNSGTSQVQLFSVNTTTNMATQTGSFQPFTGQGSNTVVHTAIKVVNNVVEVFAAQGSDGREWITGYPPTPIKVYSVSSVQLTALQDFAPVFTGFNLG